MTFLVQPTVRFTAYMFRLINITKCPLYTQVKNGIGQIPQTSYSPGVSGYIILYVYHDL